MDPRWQQLDKFTRGFLVKAGVENAEQLEQLTNAELRAIPQIGDNRRRKIRKLFPAPRGTQVLVPGPRGGALRRGGPLKEGPTTRELRGDASRRFAKMLDRLEAVALDRVGGKPCKCCGRGPTEVSIETQVRAIDVLGKYGPGTQREVTHALDLEKAKELAQSLAAGVQKHVMDEAVLQAVFEEWTAVFRAFFPKAS